VQGLTGLTGAGLTGLPGAGLTGLTGTGFTGLTGLPGAGAHAQGRSVHLVGMQGRVRRFVERALHPYGMHALQSNASPRAFRRTGSAFRWTGSAFR
jgi:hypothetical protein